MSNEYKEFSRLLSEYAHAAMKLMDAWEKLDGEEYVAPSDGYPEYMPSFDEHVMSVLEWQHKLSKKVGEKL